MKYAVAVQHTETLEISLMGPFDDEEHATMIRTSFVVEMDAKYGILDVYSVWIVPLRSMSTEIKAMSSLMDLYRRSERESRTLENLDQLDV